MGTSLTDIIRELTERLHPGKIVLGTTTEAGGDGTDVVDDERFANSDADANTYDGAIVRIDEFVTSGPDVGEAQRVTTGGYAGATGTFITDAFTATIQDTMDFSMHRGLRPAEKEKIINRILSECHHKAFHLLSAITNHDYEEITGTEPDSWTSVNTTRSRVTATTPAFVGYGRYAIKLSNTGVDGYVKCNDVPANEGETWVAYVPACVGVAAASSEARLIVYDKTNSNVEIDRAVTVNEKMADLFFTFSVPSGCKEIYVKMQGSLSGGANYYFGPVQLLPLSQAQIALPSWISNMNQLRRAVVIPIGSSSGHADDDNAYRSFETEPVSVNYRPMFAPLHANPARIIVKPSQAGPLFVDCWRPFAELTEANTSPETDMDHDTLIAGALAGCHEAMAERLSNVDIGRARFHKGQAGKEWGRYADLRRKNGYALPESQVVRPRRRLVRLQ